MTEGGASEPTPIVHNGIIYLASPSNIVQALDARTGTLIWETRVGPDQAPGYGGIRSIAIADDKILLPASNAHMVALSGVSAWLAERRAGQQRCRHVRSPLMARATSVWRAR